MNKIKNGSKGFTLLELLVVVLIIGLLAGIALPQYKKAVWRSRAKAMLPVLRSMRTSIDAFYMVNGAYPTKFDELDITLEGYTKSCNYLGSAYQTGGCKANDYLNLFLNSTGPSVSIAMFQFNKGPYKGAGFIGYKIFKCFEHKSYIPELKSFCEKVMGCQLSSNSGADYRYTCPDL